MIDLDELLFRNRIISVPFELEFGILIAAIPLPEKSQKECCLSQETAERKRSE